MSPDVAIRRLATAGDVIGEHADKGSSEGAVLAHSALVRHDAAVEHRADRLPLRPTVGVPEELQVVVAHLDGEMDTSVRN